MYQDLINLTIRPGESIHDAVTQMELSKVGIVMIVDDAQKLVGTITDGDLRRATLAGFETDSPVSVLLDYKASSPFAKPVTAPVDAGPAELLVILEDRKILHLPLVDEEQRVVALVTMSHLLAQKNEPLQAVIMAGGMGTRLQPLTNDLPKPMLPVGDRPLLEIIVSQLKAADIHNISVSVRHQAEKIENYFGDGSKFGVDITYATEEQPLGTAGALGLMDLPAETTLVMNGDILSAVDLRAMLAYHRENSAELTVAVHQQEFQIPYGVIESDGSLVTALSEKPTIKMFINAGIYLLEPSVYQLIPEGERYDMTDLIGRLLEEKKPVAAFPVREYWIDIGQHSDYEQAIEDITEGRVSL
jgi:dTDP-glucose pyrophosphorylase